MTGRWAICAKNAHLDYLSRLVDCDDAFYDFMHLKL